MQTTIALKDAPSALRNALARLNHNGACAITTEGKALRDVWRQRGETLAWKVR